MGSDGEKDKKSHHHSLGLGRVASAASGAVEAKAGAAAGMVSKGFETLTGRINSAVDGAIHRGSSGDSSSGTCPITKQEKDRPVPVTHASSDPMVGALGIAGTGSDVSNSNDDDNDDESSHTGIIFHKEKDNDFKFTALYWRHGIVVPENGRFRLHNDKELSFKGLIGTKLSFDVERMEIENASRMGGLVNDSFRIRATQTEVDPSTETLSSSCGKMEKDIEKGESYLFTPVLKDRKEVIDKIQAAIANAKLHKEELAFDAAGGEKTAKVKKPLFRMPPDPILQKMTSIGKQKMRGVSLQDYYEVAWSEGENCDKKPIYGPFLTSCGKNNVVVNSWETEPSEYKGEWCGETYTQQRTVTFNFMKQTIGQTLVEVKHTQRCRRTDNNQCIVHMTLEMKGFPYADYFVLEVRHVASRLGENDLQVEIGMFVRFLKSCMMEGKIRKNTGVETTKTQLDLLGRTVEGCKQYAKEVEGPEEDDEEESTDDKALLAIKNNTTNISHGPIELPEPIIRALRMIMMVFVTLFRALVEPYIPPELLNPFPPSTVDEAMESVRARMDLLEEISLKSVTERRKTDIDKEVKVIKKSLSRIEQISKLPKSQTTEKPI